MPSDLPYHIALAGIAAIMVLYFVIRAWTYGVFRPIVSVASLFAGVAAGFFAFRSAGHFLVLLNFEPEPVSTLAFSLLAGLGVFLLLRKTGHSVFESIFTGETFAGRCLSGPFGAVLSLVPAALIIASLAAGLRIYGTFAELRHVESCAALYSTGDTNYPATPYATKLRNAFEKIPRASAILDQFDPYSPKAKRNLVGLALISRHYSLYLKLDTHKLAVEIYTQPDVRSLLGNPEVTPLLDDGKLRELLRNQRIIETSAVPEIIDKLEYLDLIEALHHGLGV